MQPVRQKKIRAALRERFDGMTSQQISEITGLHPSNVRTALRAMPDTYVDRWIPGKRGTFQKVWVAVYVPPDCPHPKDKQCKGGRKPKTKWQEVN